MAISAQSQISEGEMDNLAGLTPDGFLGVRENASSEEFLYFYLIFQELWKYSSIKMDKIQIKLLILYQMPDL